MSSWSPILGLAKLKQGRTKTWVKLLAEHQGVEIHTTEPAGGPAQVENPFAHYSGRFKLSSFSKSFWVWTTSPAARWARIREVEMPKPSQTALSGSCEVHKHLNLRPVGRNPDDFPLTVGTLLTCVTFIPSRCIDEALHLQVVRFGYKPSPNLPPEGYASLRTPAGSFWERAGRRGDEHCGGLDELYSTAGGGDGQVSGHGLGDFSEGIDKLLQPCFSPFNLTLGAPVPRRRPP